MHRSHSLGNVWQSRIAITVTNCQIYTFINSSHCCYSVENHTPATVLNTLLQRADIIEHSDPNRQWNGVLCSVWRGKEGHHLSCADYTRATVLSKPSPFIANCCPQATPILIHNKYLCRLLNPSEHSTTTPLFTADPEWENTPRNSVQDLKN